MIIILIFQKGDENAPDSSPRTAIFGEGMESKVRLHVICGGPVSSSMARGILLAIRSDGVCSATQVPAR